MNRIYHSGKAKSKTVRPLNKITGTPYLILPRVQRQRGSPPVVQLLQSKPPLTSILSRKGRGSHPSRNDGKARGIVSLRGWPYQPRQSRRCQRRDCFGIKPLAKTATPPLDRIPDRIPGTPYLFCHVKSRRASE